MSEEKLDEIQSRGETNTGKPVYNLNNIYRLRIPKGNDVWAMSRDLEALPGILRARPVPKPVLPPLPADYEPQQNYLDPASFTPTGIDAEYAWTQPGGTGVGVTVCDLEYFWNYNHADVTKAVGSQININVVDPGYGPDHGTAVIGEMVADNNGWGTTGICYGASLLTCGTYYGTPFPSWNMPGAMALAIANLHPGDVILLEQRWDYTGLEDYVPIEWWTDYYPAPQSFNAVYAAIENAVANGINVVETGGNGGGDSGTITWFGDSGAIIVGAGGAYPGGTWIEGDLQKLPFSTYGPRFDLQGWGEDVVTTGYGDLYNAEGENYFYTSQFSGTSSAGPIVAGAVASCVGYWKATISPTPPTPSQVRNILKITGTPQITPPPGNIGPRPDLMAAFEALALTGVAGETGPRFHVVLEQNYPNPFNPGTRITYSIPAPGQVALTVYDIRGSIVKRLVEEQQDGGKHTVIWHGRNESGAPVASGIYLVRLEAAGETRVVKAVLLK
ncbi:MAG: S8 family serine peptidase [Candidatus Latescibacteria bacterium]|nr:S8 family serine peptidase [Candidatus Latescibacterota bacterium]NIM22202.1 S8 family serine peptidase [Candidatus Latescibacterota bacterium]NIM66241.1 S8 family serine peptidase [Candidatus Latescibacterota bacterium]NIO02317.1 S8 family serine peptidase [Candidatus Latescibacterota bacterium]NIO29848.1 S8 family serine peptidase [Candidatus Latescibacterota bacterium]